MGTVLSLPCFLRRRRHCTSPSPRNIAAAGISHPRPLGTGIPSYVHGGGGSGTPGGGSARLMSSSASATTSLSRASESKRSERARSQSIHPIMENGIASPERKVLDILPESDESDGANGIPMSSRGASGSSVVGTASTASGVHLLRRGLSSATSSSASGSGGSQRRRERDTNRSAHRTGPKRTNSYNQTKHPRIVRPRPLSFPDVNRSGSGRSTGSGSGSGGSARSALGFNRRKLRKVQRVENGWDYIRHSDLDGWDEKLGRNGRRVSILGQ